MFAFSFQRDMAHFFGSLTHPLQGKRKNNACALWRAGKSLRCWCHRSAPPRGPNCWVPVYHGVSGGRPRWAADSRLTQGPRIVLAPNALFFSETRTTQHDKHTENTERIMMIRVGQVYWNQIINTGPFLFRAQYWLCNWPNKKRLTSICDVDVFLTTTPMLRLMLLLRMILPMVNWWRNIFN